MHARFLVLGLCLVAASRACLAFGQDAHPNALAATIAPYVDNQTVAVVHVDLAAFDASKAVDALAGLWNLPQAERDRIQASVVPLNVVADALPEGARADVFLVASVSDLSTVPVFFVLPLATEAAGAISLELRRTVSAQLAAELATERIGEALVTASPRTIARLKKAAPTKRPEIAAAFEAAGACAMQVLFVPSAAARRAIELLVPKLPAALGGTPTGQLTGKLAWVAIGIDLPPEPTRFRVIVQATGNDAAAALARHSDRVLATLLAQGELREALPAPGELAKRLAPKVTQDRLTLDLDASDVARAQPLLLSVLKSAETTIAERFGARKPPER